MQRMLAIKKPWRLPLRRLGLALAFLALIGLFAVMIHLALGKTLIGADFYIFWRAGRAFLYEHANPYSEQVAVRIQQDILGRLATQGEDHLAFAYPFYSLFGLLPTLLVSYDWALSFWYALNLVCLITVLYYIFPDRMKIASASGLLLFPVAFGLVMGNFSLPVATIMLLFWGVFGLKGSRAMSWQIGLGILLAWATLKPQFVWLPLVFILLYAWKNKLSAFLVTFCGTLVLFTGLSFLFMNTWLQSWIQVVQWYAGYQQVSPVIVELFHIFLPEQAAAVAGGALLAACLAVSVYLLAAWWRGRADWLPVLAWLGLTTFLFHPHGMSYEQLPSLIPMVLWLANDSHRQTRKAWFFWGFTILISWLPLLFRAAHPKIDRAPVLWTAAWVIWIILRYNKAFVRRNKWMAAGWN